MAGRKPGNDLSPKRCPLQHIQATEFLRQGRKWGQFRTEASARCISVQGFNITAEESGF